MSLMNRTDCDARYIKQDDTLDDILAPEDDYSFNNNKLTDLADGTLSNDAVNKSQLDTKKSVGTFDTKI